MLNGACCREVGVHQRPWHRSSLQSRPQSRRGWGGGRRMVQSCGVPEAAAPGLQEGDRAGSVREPLGSAQVCLLTSRCKWTQLSGFCPGKSMYVYMRGGGRLVSRAKGRQALLQLEAVGSGKRSQGSIDTDAAGFLCTGVCCLISSISPLPSLE